MTRYLLTKSPVPLFVWGFFKLISPFIDPLTREKMKFNENLRDFVPPAQLWSIQGGDAHFEYDHSVYWSALVELAARRRNAYRERWVRAGKAIGESESYLRGSGSPSVTGFSTEQDVVGPAAQEIKSITEVDRDLAIPATAMVP